MMSLWPLVIIVIGGKTKIPLFVRTDALKNIFGALAYFGLASGIVFCHFLAHIQFTSVNIYRHVLQGNSIQRQNCMNIDPVIIPGAIILAFLTAMQRIIASYVHHIPK